MTLADRIRTARLAAGFPSQLKLAQACGWDTASRIGNYEQGTREPSLEDLRSIATAVAPSGYSYAWLVVGPEELAASGLSQSARLDPVKLSESIEALRRVAKNLGVPYDPVTNAVETAYAYELRCALGAVPSTAEVIDFGAKVADRLRIAGGR